MAFPEKRKGTKRFALEKAVGMRVERTNMKETFLFRRTPKPPQLAVIVLKRSIGPVVISIQSLSSIVKTFFPLIEGQTPLSHGSGTWRTRWSSSRRWGKDGIRVTVVVVDCRSRAKTIKCSPLNRWFTSPPGMVIVISYPTSSMMSTQAVNTPRIEVRASIHATERPFRHEDTVNT